MPAEERNIPASLTEKQANALALLRHLDLEDLAILKGVLHQGEPKVIGPHTIDALVLKCDDLKMTLTNKGVVALKDKYKLQKTGDPKTELGPTTADTLYQAILSLSGKSPFCFPFSKLPNWDWTTGARRFGANRSGPRAHAGCDLYFPAGTPIHAVGDGTVIQSAYYFYNGTYALEVDHGEFIVRYGEIQANPPVKGGAKVKRGQVIAKVGHLTGITVPSDMLHMEMYDGSLSGPLTVGAASSKRRSDGVPFLRRMDLIDPTDYLNDWKDDLP